MNVKRWGREITTVARGYNYSTDWAFASGKPLTRSVERSSNVTLLVYNTLN